MERRERSDARRWVGSLPLWVVESSSVLLLTVKRGRSSLAAMSAPDPAEVRRRVARRDDDVIVTSADDSLVVWETGGALASGNDVIVDAEAPACNRNAAGQQTELYTSSVYKHYFGDHSSRIRFFTNFKNLKKNRELLRI